MCCCNCGRKERQKAWPIRLQVIDDCSQGSLHDFINNHVQEQSNIITDGWGGYAGLDGKGYQHDRELQKEAPDKASVLPGAHLVISLVKRLILGTFQGRFHEKHLQGYLDEFVFRFNRRKSHYRGKLFYRLIQQAVQIEPTTYHSIVRHVTGLNYGKHNRS